MTKLFDCYVEKPTHDEAVEIVERLIANGAKAHDVVKGMNIGLNEYSFNDNDYWGYSYDYGTFTHDSGSAWAKRSKQLTMQEFRAAFPCEKYDSVDDEEWPQPGDAVVVDYDGKWGAVFIGKSTTDTYVCQMPEDYPHGAYDGFRRCGIRKPKPESDREKFIEAATEALKGWSEYSIPGNELLGELYDAGFKAPEDV